jgi:hypothetical protein
MALRTGEPELCRQIENVLRAGIAVQLGGLRHPYTLTIAQIDFGR